MDAIDSEMKKYKQVILNASGEVGSRLMLIAKEYPNNSIYVLCQEIDKVINHLYMIKRALIYLKNREANPK